MLADAKHLHESVFIAVLLAFQRCFCAPITPALRALSGA
jgi:hypothetical protein